MPVADEVKSSWADEVEEVVEDQQQPSEVIENGFKIVTEYRRNEDNKKVCNDWKESFDWCLLMLVSYYFLIIFLYQIVNAYS